jgi:hypothetical protein
MMRATRRRFFGLVGAAPLAAKATTDAEIARMIGAGDLVGLGNASLGLSYGGAPQSAPSGGPYVPYEKRLIGAADYIRMFGVPETMEFELRDRAKHICFIEPDIANKRSWSMTVKAMTQRQRNYEREVAKIERFGWMQRGRDSLKRFLGFDWPW